MVCFSKRQKTPRGRYPTCVITHIRNHSGQTCYHFAIAEIKYHCCSTVLARIRQGPMETLRRNELFRRSVQRYSGTGSWEWSFEVAPKIGQRKKATGKIIRSSICSYYELVEALKDISFVLEVKLENYTGTFQQRQVHYDNFERWKE